MVLIVTKIKFAPLTKPVKKNTTFEEYNISLVFHDTHFCQSDRSRDGFLVLAIEGINYLMKYTQSTKYWK